MPRLTLIARFAKDARTVRVEIESPWWPRDVFEFEKADDVEANQAIFESVRTTLLACGFKEGET